MDKLSRVKVTPYIYFFIYYQNNLKDLSMFFDNGFFIICCLFRFNFYVFNYSPIQ
jgi:hypothetical protein